MGRKKKYNTEEERKAARIEANKRWREKNKNKLLEYKARYRQQNKEKIAEYQAGYHQKNKNKLLEYPTKYRQQNKEKIAEYQAEYQTEYQAEYCLTQYGRAIKIISNYKRNDKYYNRGECTLTPQWIVDNIFSKPCHYCGETDWHKLGCDRIDNALPHTQDNVVPCCFECNIKKGITPYDEFMRMIGKVA